MSEQAIRVDHAELPATDCAALRFDAGTIGKLERTPTGGVRVPARVTREGVLVYQRADGSTVREYRPADEVFHADSLASLADCAVTVAHPESGSVTPETFRRDAVGYVRESGRRDASFVAASLVVSDGDAIARIDSGELRELSCGYRCTVDSTPGTSPGGERYDAIQRGIRYNHVALLPRGGGRAGRDVALRVDGAAVALLDEPKITDPRPDDRANRTSMKTERIDGVDYTIGSAEWTQAHALRTARIAAETTEMKAKLDAADKAAVATKAELDGVKAALTAQAAELLAAQDETKLDARIAERSALVDQAKRVLGTSVKLDGKSADAIRREVLTKLDGAVCVEGKDAAYVAIYFPARLAAVSSAQLGAARADATSVPAPNGAQPVDLSRYRVRPGDV